MFLCSERHVATLDPAEQSNKRLHQTAVCLFVQALGAAIDMPSKLT
jgi:hypothetical protein